MKATPLLLRISYSLLLFLWCNALFAQEASGIRGKVYNELNNQPIPFATIALEIDNTKAATSDAEGNFFLEVTPGLYNLKVVAAEYNDEVVLDVSVVQSIATYLEIKLKARPKQLNEITVVAQRDKTRESPVSLKTLSANEIQRSPGGNRDISNVVQSLPGAGTSTGGGFRNDLIIRGGGPAENKFFVDNIEIPTINHFATQGASGGPVGLLNVDLISGVSFLTGAFDATRGNALSSVMDVRLKNGRDDRWSGALTVGTSDIGLRGEGPLGKKTTAIVSVRRSYLQFLFKLFGLPFLPIYNDFAVKTNTKINEKTELTVLGLGAIDDFRLNKEANETEQQRYILGNIPAIKQWNYTVGVVLRRFHTNGKTEYILSRSMVNNILYKYENNEDTNPAKKVLDNNTQDADNQLKIERTLNAGKIRLLGGVNTSYVRYFTSAYNKIPTPAGVQVFSFSNEITYGKYAAYVQASTAVLQERLSLSAGIRFDGATLTSNTANLLQQPSPRLSASYNLGKGWSINGNTGLYHQLPVNTVLSFTDNQGVLVNQNASLRYTTALHAVLGVEKRMASNTRITLEGFYKDYSRYPISQITGISLANLGGDFGIVGNEAVNYTGKGRARGAEVFIQQRLYKGFYGWLAYTLVQSEFTNANGAYVPSTWDQRHILNIIIGKRFLKTWEAGLKFRYSGGNPYTPYDRNLSSLQSYWDITGRGFLDYNLVNTLRNPSSYQVDFRIDKKFFFKKWTLGLYLDLQNATQATTVSAPILTVERDAQGNPLPVQGSTPARYQTKIIDNKSKTFLQTLGIIIQI